MFPVVSTKICACRRGFVKILRCFEFTKGNAKGQWPDLPIRERDVLLTTAKIGRGNRCYRDIDAIVQNYCNVVVCKVVA